MSTGGGGIGIYQFTRDIVKGLIDLQLIILIYGVFSGKGFVKSWVETASHTGPSFCEISS